KINILGYVEGFYGRLLNWDDRIRILSKLNDCNLKTYFYCPKEDNFHRFSWKEHVNMDAISYHPTHLLHTQT
ncbi:beta-N-acetylglucosaminidase domain-containing protein, partial [bacterium]|nr:beta-N-acetylglucosaminidase domain-containing protein [bacterium]